MFLPWLLKKVKRGDKPFHDALVEIKHDVKVGNAGLCCSSVK